MNKNIGLGHKMEFLHSVVPNRNGVEKLQVTFYFHLLRAIGLPVLFVGL